METIKDTNQGLLGLKVHLLQQVLRLEQQQRNSSGGCQGGDLMTIEVSHYSEGLDLLTLLISLSIVMLLSKMVCS